MRRRVLRPSVILIGAGLLVGCASEPPVREAASAPAPGDSVEQIVQRGYRVHPVYVFALDEHQYAFADATAAEAKYTLISIDDALACASASPVDELTNWQWAGEPGGLDYLASRLRQTCGLEAGTAPRTMPFAPGAGAVPVKDDSAGEELGELSAQFAAAAATVLAWPYLIAAGVVVSPWFIAKKIGTKNHDKLQQMGLGLTRAETEAVLGKAETEFPLPAVQTTVLVYDAGRDRNFYVGLQNDRVVWVHEHDRWLNALAKQAKETKK